MGVVRKQSAYATIYAYLGVIVGFVSTGLLMPNVFSPEQNGVLKLLVSYSLLASQLGVLGFKKVTFRLFPYFRDKTKGHNGFFFLMLLVFLAGLTITFSLILLLKPVILNRADSGGALFNYFYTYIFLLTGFHLMFMLLDQYITVLMNITKSVFFKDFLQRLLILSALGIYMLDWVDFSGFVALYAGAYSAKAVLIFIVLLRAGHVHLKPQFHMLTRERLRSIFQMMSLGLFGGFASIITFQIDSIMVNKMVGLGETGVYSITFFFGTLIQIPQRSLRKISIPFVSEAFKNEDYAKLNQLVKRTSLNLLVIGSLLVIGLWGNIHNVFEILPDTYRQGKYVILFISLSNIVLLSAGVTSTLIGISRLYPYQLLFVSLHAALIIGTNLLFIPLLGLSGAALASLVSMVVITTVRISFVWYHFRILPYHLAHVKVLLAALLSYGLSLLLPTLPHFILDIAVRSALLIAVYVPIVYFLKLSPDIRDLADQIIAIIRKRLGI